jgi:hypothetical protein
MPSITFTNDGVFPSSGTLSNYTMRLRGLEVVLELVVLELLKIPVATEP